MKSAQLATLMVIAFSFGVAAQELPSRMQGKYHSPPNRGGDATLELVKQESPDTARVRVNLTNTLNAHAAVCGFSAVETEARRVDGAWKLSFPGRYCSSSWTMTIRAVEGKQRFEGTYNTDTPVWTEGTVYFEW
jgi:hypothetical protein